MDTNTRLAQSGVVLAKQREEHKEKGRRIEWCSNPYTMPLLEPEGTCPQTQNRVWEEPSLQQNTKGQ